MMLDAIFLKLRSVGRDEPTLVPMTNIAYIVPAEKGTSLVYLKSGDYVCVDVPPTYIWGLLVEATNG